MPRKVRQFQPDWRQVNPVCRATHKHPKVREWLARQLIWTRGYFANGG